LAGRRPIPSRLVAAAVLIAIPLLLLYRALFFGDALVPADLLSYVAPWSHLHPPTAAWNVLRYDGITQFYPWRLFTARSFQSGHIPLWNPYTFAAAGGAPLLADSQSAPLYPPNALFYLLPPTLFPFAFGLLAALQLTIAGTGLYRLLRSLPLRRIAALLGASAFVLSGPIITWLSLPTFLSVACWIPWLLLAVRTAHGKAGTPTGRRALLGAGDRGSVHADAGYSRTPRPAYQSVSLVRRGRRHGRRWNAAGIAAASACRRTKPLLASRGRQRRLHQLPRNRAPDT
jgi:hypothetical protein